jgi:hypothetical protein
VVVPVRVSTPDATKDVNKKGVEQNFAEYLTVAQLVNKFLLFYVARRLIAFNP